LLSSSLHITVEPWTGKWPGGLDSPWDETGPGTGKGWMRVLKKAGLEKPPSHPNLSFFSFSLEFCSTSGTQWKTHPSQAEGCILSQANKTSLPACYLYSLHCSSSAYSRPAERAVCGCGCKCAYRFFSSGHPGASRWGEWSLWVEPKAEASKNDRE
jgi:hypothetical protein